MLVFAPSFDQVAWITIGVGSLVFLSFLCVEPPLEPKEVPVVNLDTVATPVATPVGTPVATPVAESVCTERCQARVPGKTSQTYEQCVRTAGDTGLCRRHTKLERQYATDPEDGWYGRIQNA
jgi:hypothetical protein